MAKGKNYAKRLRLIIKTEREYQYVAIDLALQNVRRFSLEEVVAFKAYVPQKRGGTVWMLGENFGSWVALHLTELPTILPFYGAENFWNRRVALNLQLMLKEKTNQDLLKRRLFMIELQRSSSFKSDWLVITPI